MGLYDCPHAGVQLFGVAMRRLAFCILLAAAPAAAQPPIGSFQLEPYIGGRVLASTASGATIYTYAWPGVYFEAQFTGDSVDVKLDDDQNNLYLYIDGTHKLTLTRPGRTTVALKDLGPGPHTVRLEKASETQASTGRFEGFYVDSADRALPAPRYDRRIEFIGDSFTVGYGDTSRGQVCTVDDVRDTTDTSLAFAPITAKHFNAAYRIHAFSGRGVVRNYNGLAPGEALPTMYQYTLFDKSASAPEDGWTPDVVVIGLGTNDFSTPLNPGETWSSREALHADFEQAYAAFVKSLRTKWRSAHIILMASTEYNGEISQEVLAAADAAKRSGVEDLETISFSNLDYQACHGHPSLKDEAILSQLLIDRIALLPRFEGVAP